MDKVEIVVITNGFVYVGYTATDEGYLYIRNAKNVRSWGTTRGLGQIAAEGPAKETILDDGGHLRVSKEHVIFTIEADAEKWRRRLT